MNAAKKKLESRSGATILMALLFMLVAMMVSAVIIAAASTATRSLQTRRDNQQAYLTCSSAAEFFRDNILNKTGYRSQFALTLDPNDSNKILSDPRAVTGDIYRTDGDIIKIVDEFLAHYYGGKTSRSLVDTSKATSASLVFRMEDMSDVTVVLQFEPTPEDPANSDTQTVYTLTGSFSLDSSSPALCYLTLKMRCVVEKQTIDIESSHKRNIIYTAHWSEEDSEIQRYGLEAVK